MYFSMTTAVSFLNIFILRSTEVTRNKALQLSLSLSIQRKRLSHRLQNWGFLQGVQYFRFITSLVLIKSFILLIKLLSHKKSFPVLLKKFLKDEQIQFITFIRISLIFLLLIALKNSRLFLRMKKYLSS